MTEAKQTGVFVTLEGSLEQTRAWWSTTKPFREALRSGIAPHSTDKHRESVNDCELFMNVEYCKIVDWERTSIKIQR